MGVCAAQGAGGLVWGHGSDRGLGGRAAPGFLCALWFPCAHARATAGLFSRHTCLEASWHWCSLRNGAQRDWAQLGDAAGAGGRPGCSRWAGGLGCSLQPTMGRGSHKGTDLEAREAWLRGLQRPGRWGTGWRGQGDRW